MKQLAITHRSALALQDCHRFLRALSEDARTPPDIGRRARSLLRRLPTSSNSNTSSNIDGLSRILAFADTLPE